MKIFLVTRGSHGDVYPYLAVAAELKKRGHEITLSLPEIFEKQAKESGMNYLLQQSDDIGGMLEDAGNSSQSTPHILKWVKRVIDKQFEQFIPVLQEHDIMVATNTEFAAVSLAEYCNKPIIRTAYAPLIPGKKIPPPIIPLCRTNAVLKPVVMWKLLNLGTNFMVRKTLNKNREKLGMSPLKSYGEHAAGNARNYLMYSNHLGNTDPDWIYPWKVGGYCFNNSFEYDRQVYDELMAFIRKDNRPTLFFTLGSCDAKQKDLFCEKLLRVCNHSGYKLLVGSGWSKTGAGLQNNDDLFLMEKPIPHNLIFPYCDAVIHHGGSGTTHSVAYAGKPQMIVPLIIDQEYWASRLEELNVGPGRVKITVSEAGLKEKIVDLIANPLYKESAFSLAEKMKTESGIDNLCNYIESFQ